jgi:hypothetical protein
LQVCTLLLFQIFWLFFSLWKCLFFHFSNKKFKIIEW